MLIKKIKYFGFLSSVLLPFYATVEAGKKGEEFGIIENDLINISTSSACDEFRTPTHLRPPFFGKDDATTIESNKRRRVQPLKRSTSNGAAQVTPNSLYVRPRSTSADLSLPDKTTPLNFSSKSYDEEDMQKGKTVIPINAAENKKSKPQNRLPALDAVENHKALILAREGFSSHDYLDLCLGENAKENYYIIIPKYSNESQELMDAHQAALIKYRDIFAGVTELNDYIDDTEFYAEVQKIVDGGFNFGLIGLLSERDPERANQLKLKYNLKYAMRKEDCAIFRDKWAMHQALSSEPVHESMKGPMQGTASIRSSDRKEIKNFVEGVFKKQFSVSVRPYKYEGKNDIKKLHSMDDYEKFLMETPEGIVRSGSDLKHFVFQEYIPLPDSIAVSEEEGIKEQEIKKQEIRDFVQGVLNSDRLVFVKPRKGMGANGTKKIDSIEAYEEFLTQKLEERMVDGEQKPILNSEKLDHFIFQEYIDAFIYHIDILTSQDGEVLKMWASEYGKNNPFKVVSEGVPLKHNLLDDGLLNHKLLDFAEALTKRYPLLKGGSGIHLEVFLDRKGLPENSPKEAGTIIFGEWAMRPAGSHVNKTWEIAFDIDLHRGSLGAQFGLQFFTSVDAAQVRGAPKQYAGSVILSTENPGNSPTEEELKRRFGDLLAWVKVVQSKAHSYSTDGGIHGVIVGKTATDVKEGFEKFEKFCLMSKEERLADQKKHEVSKEPSDVLQRNKYYSTDPLDDIESSATDDR